MKIFNESSLARLLATPLNIRLLEFEITADWYARNGFRFIATPACAEHNLFLAESQRFRNLYKLNPAAALKSAIQTGYDGYLPLEGVLNYLAKLDDPRYRIICELFWPHLPASIFDRVKEQQHISSAEVLQSINAHIENPHQQNHGIIHHALAIACHNQAIAAELAFAAGSRKWDGNGWQEALSCWANLLELDSFWEYLAGRAEGFDDPRLKPEDIQELRDKLPIVILEFNAIFARAYAKANQAEASARHILLIQQSPLPESAKHQVSGELVKVLTVARLEPLIEQVKSKFSEKTDRQSRQEFDKTCKPVLQETLAVRDYLLEELKFPPAMVELSEFDRLCQLIVEGLERKIDYKSDDHARSILYATLITPKMLTLPLSSSLRRKLEQSLLEEREILYGEFVSSKSKGAPIDIDPGQCWFLEGEEADPDSSLVLPVYKITEVKGGSVGWQKRQILVPRSQLAARVHQGKLSLEELAKLRQDEETKTILTEIERLETERDKAIKGIEKNLNSAIQQHTSAFEEQLQAFNQQAATEEKKHQDHKQKVHSQLEKDIAAENHRCEQACRKARGQAAIPIAKAEAEYQKTVRDNKGLRGGVRLELPVIVISFSLILFAAYIWNAFTIGVGGEIAGIMAGIIIGRVVRKYRVQKASLLLQAIQRTLAEELSRLRKESENTIARLKKAAEVNLKETTVFLNGLAQQRTNMQSEYVKKVSELRKQTDREIKELQKNAAGKIQALRKKLETYLKPRAESEKKSFPPYKTAKSRGYEDGAGPSQNEVNRLAQAEFDRFMNSLSYEEKNLLAILSQYLSNQQMNEILNTLISLSSYERWERIRTLTRTMRGY